MGRVATIALLHYFAGATGGMVPVGPAPAFVVPAPAFVVPAPAFVVPAPALVIPAKAGIHACPRREQGSGLPTHVGKTEAWFHEDRS